MSSLAILNQNAAALYFLGYKDAMTGDEARAVLDHLDWSVKQFARNTRQDDHTARRQLNGQEPIPEPLADWLENLDHVRATYCRILEDPPKLVRRLIA